MRKRSTFYLPVKVCPRRLKVAILIIICLFIVVPSAVSFAQDTVSTAGVQFTSAPSNSVSLGKKDSSKSISNQQEKKAAKSTDKKAKQQTLLAIFLAGLAFGFTAILMPCIFPMLPLTVSFFTKQAEKGGSAVGKAMLYGLSIVVIYVVLGLLVTIIFGADALNNFSTNGVFNFGFFLLIVVFAASFLGAFELNLPNSWANKMDQKSERGGMLGLFFMAATLALVSFSCTGPIIGYLLVQAAVSGAILAPAIGMLGFSIALAIPFTIFALFPGWLKSLPRSGGWLNSVKVVLGFLELALALKFLSNVDLAYHWHLLSREVFLSLWIVIFALMGFYLLGKITFSHDSPLQHLSVPRLFLAIIVLSFCTYMVPGLWGAPLKSISAILPPASTQDFDLYNNSTAINTNQISDAQPQKYVSLFDKPKGFNPFFDYDEGLAYAKKMDKPVMIDFTGHACVNCRKMEANVWPDANVSHAINQDYVLIQLYVDDKTDLSENEQTTTPEGRKIKTIGNKWSYLQTSKFEANSQPFYVLLDPRTEQVLVPPQGANYDPQQFYEYLKSGLNNYKK
jgi:thiol:disulfide interchange protein